MLKNKRKTRNGIQISHIKFETYLWDRVQAGTKLNNNKLMLGTLQIQILNSRVLGKLTWCQYRGRGEGAPIAPPSNLLTWPVMMDLKLIVQTSWPVFAVREEILHHPVVFVRDRIIQRFPKHNQSIIEFKMAAKYMVRFKKCEKSVIHTWWGDILDV